MAGSGPRASPRAGSGRTTVTEHAEGMLGWRLWRLRDGQLCSWAVTYEWKQGSNSATCLSPNTARCTHSPGRHCQCGFWALNSPLDCLARGRYDGIGWSPVMGLMRGWGTVALHGREGFRAQHASVVCLFSDWPFIPRAMRLGGKGWVRWWRILSLLLQGEAGPVPDQRERLGRLPETARAYGVPLVSIADSMRLGLLQELSVGTPALDEIRAWLKVAAE